MADAVHRSDGVVRVKVNIDGEYLTVRGQATDEYVQQLASYVDNKIEEGRRGDPNLPRHRAAILAALHLADEVFRLKRENGELFELLEEAR